jgi:hypothetical protein
MSVIGRSSARTMLSIRSPAAAVGKVRWIRPNRARTTDA